MDDRLHRAAEIVAGFLNYCRRNRILETGHKLWALYDYTHGCRADKWYRENAQETLKFLDSLDSDKQEVAELQEIMRPVVEGWT